MVHLEHYQPYGTGKTWTRHLRCTVSRLSASGPTHDDVAFAQSQSWTSSRKLGPISSSQKSVNSSGSHEPANLPNHPQPQRRSRNKNVHPDHMKQVMAFMGHRHLLHTPIFPLIRSPLLYIAPHFTNASLHHNSLPLTLRIALYRQQDNLPQNMLQQISRMVPPITCENREKIVLKNASCN